jgi:predicted membrane GTPase involved in stress response
LIFHNASSANPTTTNRGAGDELVEVTPSAIRLRKRVLAAGDRKRT